MPSKEVGLRYYLYIFGFLNVFVVSSVPVLLGDFLLWSPRNIPTELMLSSVNVAMGVMMLITARNPTQHKAFVDFLILANLLHAGVMAVTAQKAVHLLVDVVGQAIMGLLPLLFYPWGLRRFLAAH
jgi:hypothetical protein